jgi:hypothetical protein
VDGKPFDECGTRYNRIGFWFPIIFWRNSDLIQKKVRGLTEDKIVQGCLFYIYTTGHKAIEFVVKSEKSLHPIQVPIILMSLVGLFKRKSPKLVLEPISNERGNSFLYDGTYYLNGERPEDVRNALDCIEKYIGSLRKKIGDDIHYRLKYQLYSDALSLKKEKVGENTFSITLSMDDPRSTLVASNLELFPKSDWRIREEWV